MARRTTYFEYINPYEEKIKDLQNELDDTRYTVISLMPEEVKKVLRSYYSCDRKETHLWSDRTAKKIIEFAKILSPEEGSYYSERAYCPLCGDSSSSYDAVGFSIPEGLYRHLVG